MSHKSHSRVSRRLLTASLGLTVWGAASTTAWAANPSDPTDVDNATQDPTPAIWQGADTTTCAWPSAVAVQSAGGLCTGTLIHPEIVVYAAHCGSATQAIRFGESLSSPTTVAPEFCLTNPNYGGTADQANDWAFCKLPQAMEVPFTPTVYGCEEQILYAGQDIALVGFGGNQTDNSGSGTKRWAMTTLDSISIEGNASFTNGDPSASVCPGDSGGPAFVRFPDGGWRAFGIASTVQGSCGGGGTHSLIMGAAEWIESESGVDVTVCHDIDGTWNPGPYCGNIYAQDGGVGTSTWNDACATEPTTGWVETCGGSLPSLDSQDPTVAIVTPTDGTEFDTAPATFDIEVDATDDLSYIKVSLMVNGELLEGGDDDNPPYRFDSVTFPEGAWVLQAQAQDAAGNVVISEAVGIGVGQPAPETGDSGGDGGDDGDGDGDDAGSDGDGDGDTDGDDFGLGDGDDGSDGCSVAATDRGRASALALAFLALCAMPLRRRRVR